MNDQEFMALNDEVERLQKNHERAGGEKLLSIEQKKAIAAQYIIKYRELQDEVFRRAAEDKDD